MEADQIPIKTERGRHEVSTRERHLGVRERTVLIMVNGRASAGDLMAQLAFMKTADKIFDELLAGGYIDVAQAPVELPAPTPEALAAQAAAPLDGDARRAQQFARRFVLDALGPDGDDMAQRIELCRTRNELLSSFEKCREFLEVAAGQRRAQEFWAGLGPAVVA